MLEHVSLFLRAWEPTSDVESDDSGIVRAIVDDVGVEVGLVRQPLGPAPRWWRWFARATLEVYENPDNSLVFTLRRSRGWPATWSIVDADEKLIGSWRTRSLVDGFGQFLALLEESDRDASGRFLTLEGRQLATYDIGPNGTLLTFDPMTAGNPFARMLLLGAVLAREG